ncbi:hypothetical protein B0H10DRAFT_1964866 [Mycena sp. CBHHK59/15]|nr:hypothetical protein B0H10DRAFT_1964866 [Mycena sp. CBHHK59/15]
MCRTFWNVSDLMNVSRRVAVSGFREPQEKAALYARVLWYRDTTYATMTKDAQNAAEEMFTSIKQRVKFKFEFPTDAELRCARLFGSKMHLWFFASYSMPLDVHKHHEDYFRPHISSARESLAQSVAQGASRAEPFFPGFLPQGFVRQLKSHRTTNSLEPLLVPTRQGRSSPAPLVQQFLLTHFPAESDLAAGLLTDCPLSVYAKFM